MALIRFSSQHDPTNAILGLQREVERAFRNPLGRTLGLSGRGVHPPINVFGNDEGYLVRVEVPGLTPADINIESQGHTLVISGKRQPNAPEGGSFHRRERDNGSFSRSLQLPEDLDLSHTEATYKHGMLTLQIPRREEAKAHQITVTVA